jgi:UrcA family protein
MRSTPAILAAVLAATTFATPAVAKDEGVAVSYADLDLSTEVGQAKLERRIDKAARSVCGLDETRVGTRLQSREAKACFDETMAAMREQVAQRVAAGTHRG